MLIIQDVATFTRTVNVNVPSDGGFKKQSFHVTFAVLPTDRFSQLDMTTEEGVREFLREVIVHFNDVFDEEKKAIPYDEDIRDALIGVPYIRTALAAEYLNAVGGAAEGN